MNWSTRESSHRVSLLSLSSQFRIFKVKALLEAEKFHRTENCMYVALHGYFNIFGTPEETVLLGKVRQSFLEH